MRFKIRKNNHLYTESFDLDRDTQMLINKYGRDILYNRDFNVFIDVGETPQDVEFLNEVAEIIESSGPIFFSMNEFGEAISYFMFNIDAEKKLSQLYIKSIIHYDNKDDLNVFQDMMSNIIYKIYLNTGKPFFTFENIKNNFEFLLKAQNCDNFNFKKYFYTFEFKYDKNGNPFKEITGYILDSMVKQARFVYKYQRKARLT